MEAVAIGSSNFDQLIRVRALPRSNEIADVLATSWQYGGPVSTAIAAVSHLGHRAGIVCTVGGRTGEYIVQDLERFGVDTSRVVKMADRQSPMYICLADDETGGRSFVEVLMPHRVEPVTVEQIDWKWLCQAQYLLIAEETHASLEAARRFHESGRDVVLDADETIGDLPGLLPLVNHLLMAESQYNLLFGTSQSYEENLRSLRRQQAGPFAVTIVTLGERGMAGIDEKGAFFRQPAYPIQLIDSTGAGDSFHGGYIAARLEGMSAQDACRFASAVSAICCSYLGGRAGLPDRRQVEEFMRTGRTDFETLAQRAKHYARAPFMTE